MVHNWHRAHLWWNGILTLIGTFNQPFKPCNCFTFCACTFQTCTFRTLVISTEPGEIGWCVPRQLTLSDSTSIETAEKDAGRGAHALFDFMAPKTDQKMGLGYLSELFLEMKSIEQLIKLRAKLSAIMLSTIFWSSFEQPLQNYYDNTIIPIY